MSVNKLKSLQVAKSKDDDGGVGDGVFDIDIDNMSRLLSQTTLRNILGTKNLHEILSDREGISGAMQVIFPVFNSHFNKD